MKYNWVLFDLDNTLMDFSRASKKAFSSAFKDYGFKEAKGHYAIYEQYNHAVWKDFEDGKIDAITLRRKRFDDFFLSLRMKGIDGMEFNSVYLDWLVEHSFMLEGAVELLDAIHGKAKMAIITNGLKEVQRRRIKRLGIEKYFDVIVVSDEEGVSKPSKAYFDIVLERCGYPDKSSVLVIGDSLNSDMRGGNENGMATCWCNLFGQRNATDIQPNFEINHLRELDAILN